MPAVVSTPFISWVASLTGQGVNQSANVYFSINNTGGWEIRIPVRIWFSNVSGDPIVFVYPTHDGGANYDQTPYTGFSVARLASGQGMSSIALPTGQYMLQVQHSGYMSAYVMVMTQDVISSVVNV